ncbi:unnamed protein product [Trichogramma brassicae]|uniref:Uncharacterized protein n=1 Tax=Trichogramma brassicae TaxID=86971 RepID=A0A6H5HU92_9HYME|nr:unnamed protein product [Trichogramma brassicae]
MEQHLLDLDELLTRISDENVTNGKISTSLRATKKRDKIRRFRTHHPKEFRQTSRRRSHYELSRRPEHRRSQRLFGYGKCQRTFHSETRRICRPAHQTYQEGRAVEMGSDANGSASRVRHSPRPVPSVQSASESHSWSGSDDTPQFVNPAWVPMNLFLSDDEEIDHEVALIWGQRAFQRPPDEGYFFRTEQRESVVRH